MSFRALRCVVGLAFGATLRCMLQRRGSTSKHVVVKLASLYIFRVLSIGLPFYLGDPKKDFNVENHPYPIELSECHP